MPLAKAMNLLHRAEALFVAISASLPSHLTVVVIASSDYCHILTLSLTRAMVYKIFICLGM